MKLPKYNLIVLFVLCLAFIIPCVGATTCGSPAAGIQHWWPADGTTSDTVGSANANLLNGATYSPGFVNQGFYFDGVNDYASIPHPGYLSQGSVEAWVYFVSVPSSINDNGWMWLCIAQNPMDQNFDGLDFGVHPKYSNNLAFGIYDWNPRPGQTVPDDTNPGEWRWADSGIVPQAGKWYHFVGTWGSEGIKIYIDGVLRGQNAYTGGIPSYTKYMFLGSSTWNGYSNSIVDEFRIYNRALSASEILALYNSCKPPVAAFEASPLWGPAPSTVKLTDLSTGDGITSRVWQYQLNSDGSWITFIPNQRNTIRFSEPGLYEIKLTVTGTGGPDEEIKSLSVGCDYSTQPDIERCFGGIGKQCEGFPLSFTYDPRTCNVKGWMSTGSILHDQCCLDTANTGVGCAKAEVGTSKCQAEWGEAVLDTSCGSKALREWQIQFGPYLYGNTGDFGDVPKALLRTPSGKRINPTYESLCVTGKCKVDRKTGLTLLYTDSCSAYCVCA